MNSNRIKPVFFLCVLTLLMTLEVQANTTYVKGMTNEKFIERFNKLTFGKGNKFKSSKFVSPIRVILKGSDQTILEQYRPKIEQTLKIIRDGADIDIDMWKTGQKANYVIVLSETPVFEMLVTVKDIVRFFAANDDERFYKDVKEFERDSVSNSNSFVAIESGELKGCLNIQKVRPSINDEEAIATARRLERTFLYCLGLKRHYFKNDDFSIITSGNNNAEFSYDKTSYTDFDMASLKLLYNDGFSVGSSLDEAQDTVQRIVTENQ